MKVIPNILREQSLQNIEDFWDAERYRVSQEPDIQHIHRTAVQESLKKHGKTGYKRDVVLVTNDIMQELCGDDLAEYYVHGGFLSLAGEPYTIHCDSGSSPTTHNLCINLVPDDQTGNQALVLFKQTAKQRITLVNDDTPDDILKAYAGTGYTGVYEHNIHNYVDNILEPPEESDEKTNLLKHTWAQCIKYLSIEAVIPHRYNQGIEFHRDTLHSGAYAVGDHKRMILYVKKL